MNTISNKKVSTKSKTNKKTNAGIKATKKAPAAEMEMQKNTVTENVPKIVPDNTLVEKRVSTNDYMETKESLKKEIGARLRRIRKRLAMTQEDMVSNLNIGRANYSRIEKGEVFPNPTIFEVLYFQFNVSLEWIICNQGEMFRGESESSGNMVKLNDSTQEIKDLLFHIENVPMVKHAILSYFLEYKCRNEKFIEPVLKQAQ